MTGQIRQLRFCTTACLMMAAALGCFLPLLLSDFDWPMASSQMAAVGVLTWVADQIIAMMGCLLVLILGHETVARLERSHPALFSAASAFCAASAPERLRLVARFVIATYRGDDATALAWRPVDALLESWRGSRLAMSVPFIVAAGLLFVHEGFYGLITNTENLCKIAAGPYLAIKALRKYRQIETPKRPEKKVLSAGRAKELGEGPRPPSGQGPVA